MNAVIPAPTLDWPVLVPLLIVTGVALACLILDLLPPADRKGHLAAAGVVGLTGALAASVVLWDHPPARFQAVVALDQFALFFNVVISLTTALVLLLSIGYIRRQGIEVGEYYALVLFAAVGMMLMASALDLLLIFLGLELMSLSLYVLAGFFRTRAGGNESALKYFLLGAFASSFFLYGIALLYGATGSTSLETLAAALAGQGGSGRDWVVLAGFGLLLVGFGFKTSAVPFHQWAPDVYTGAPTAVAALIATGSKAAAFAALVRVLVAARVFESDWTPLLWVAAVLTMTVGNVIALAQGNLKRMLAYSSVAHAGYMLVGLTGGGAAGGTAVLYYLLVYSFATVGAFGVILLLELGEPPPSGSPAEAVDLAAYGGLAARHPVLALALTVFLLSLIGMPPTAGFVGKLYLFSAAIKSGLIWLGVIAVLNSVVAAYYYLRLIVYMYMRAPEGPVVPARLTPAAGLSLALAAWATIHLGILPADVLALAQRAVAPLFP
ncbi:MAG TPA: NADH-quinone oxidoreductase subunit N [Solirubrobacterales bacterium]|nr:NADH-quinone oxidoreductase subunit N [Solirubrobacterales bacterium]